MKNWTALILLVFLAFSWACKKTIPDDTQNPFGDDVINPINDSIDPTSLKGLHQQIFVTKCANPNCHDGAFEPDFRTIESTYQTLVYQEVIKNDTANSFEFRVVPNNVEESWLIERLVTNDPVLGRMPLYAVPLSFQEMENIKAWINSGAPDAEGNVTVYPNTVPKVRYFVAYDSAEVRIDTGRVDNWSSPFKVRTNEDFTIMASVQDDSTAVDQLLINKMYFSYDPLDFSNAITLNATYYYSSLWRVDIPANTFTNNNIVYFRYEVKDPDNAAPTVHPNDNSPIWFKENASFIIQ